MDPELAQRFDEISQHFTVINQRFEQLNGRLDARFGAIDARFERIDDRFLAMDEHFEELKDRVEESKRYSGILVEGLRQEVRHVAEGLLMHIEVRHREDRDYFDRKFEDTQALTRSSYDHLQQQQDQTRRRVENLERPDQN